MDNDNEQQQIVNAALAVRSMRMFNDHLGFARFAVEDAQRKSIESVREVRDEMAEQLTSLLRSQTKLIEQISEMMALMQERLAQAPVVNIPQQRVILQQQPVTVNVEKPQVVVQPQINPVVKGPDVVVNVPEKDVIVQTPEKPSKFIITHSDGTKSTLEVK